MGENLRQVLGKTHKKGLKEIRKAYEWQVEIEIYFYLLEYK